MTGKLSGKKRLLSKGFITLFFKMAKFGQCTKASRSMEDTWEYIENKKTIIDLLNKVKDLRDKINIYETKYKIQK